MAFKQLRKPFFILAIVLFAVAALLEAGSGLFTDSTPAEADVASKVGNELKGHVTDAAGDEITGEVLRALKQREKPGLGLRYLAWLDAIVFYVIGMAGVGLILPAAIQGKLQSIVTLVVSLVTLVISVVMIFAAFQLLLTMVTLVTAPPFGTAAYMATWGFFDRRGARMILSASLLLKIGFAVSLVAAHQRYLLHKGFIFLTLMSLLAAATISLLHGAVPLALVSIADALAAIVVGVLAVVVAIVLLVGAVIGVIKLVT
jgi:hypothetical protein